MPYQTDNRFTNANAYEHFVGRWSREVAIQFIAWLDVSPQRIWLDMGTGTGILSDIILQQANPTRVVGVDTSLDYVNLAQERFNDLRVQFLVGDVADIDLADTNFDVAVAGLVLNFVPSPLQAVKNMARLVKAEGLVAAYVWDYADKMEMMRHFWAATIQVDSAAAELDSGRLFTICNPDSLKSLFETSNLTEIDVIPIDIQTVFKDFDDYWQPFLAAQGSVSKYLHSIGDETRNQICDQLKGQLPIQEDGTIHLIARAWAIKGFKH